MIVKNETLGGIKLLSVLLYLIGAIGTLVVMFYIYLIWQDPIIQQDIFNPEYCQLSSILKISLSILLIPFIFIWARNLWKDKKFAWMLMLIASGLTGTIISIYTIMAVIVFFSDFQINLLLMYVGPLFLITIGCFLIFKYLWRTKNLTMSLKDKIKRTLQQ